MQERDLVGYGRTVPLERWVRDFLAWVAGQPEVTLVYRQQVADWWTEHCG